MARRQKEPESSGGVPEWMATYGDLVTLLMCFFVLLFAFSSIDSEKFREVMKSFQGSAGLLESGTSLSPSDLIFDGLPESKVSYDQEALKQAKEIKTLKESLEKFKKENNKQFDFNIEGNDIGIKITFPDNVLFDPGSATIKPEAYALLDYISALLQAPDFVNRQVQVEGHTDNVPINTVQFPSNWELSTGRASRVVRYFTENEGMLALRFAPIGYGEFRPIASNDTQEGRSQNRRVDIVVLADEATAEQAIEQTTEDTN